MRRFASVGREDHVGTVTLARPEALNAISGAMADELAGAVAEIASDPGVWVVLVQAEGDRAFCVGADLKERAGFSLADWHRNRRQMRGLFAALRSVAQPTIACLFGYALGGGLELALSCDMIVAASGTELGLTEARVGLVPGGGGTQLLPRTLGMARAKEIIFTGGRFSAEDAATWGLVNRVVAAGDLRAAARKLAGAICASSPVSVAAAKKAMDSAPGLSLDDGIEVENGAWTVVVSSRDRVEGIAAFNEKRAPRWGNA